MEDGCLLLEPNRRCSSRRSLAFHPTLQFAKTIRTSSAVHETCRIAEQCLEALTRTTSQQLGGFVCLEAFAFVEYGRPQRAYC